MTEYERLSPLFVKGKVATSIQGDLMGTMNEMPSPSADYDGITVQYLGPEGLGGYHSGYFYRCEESAGAYSWVTHNPPGGGGGSTNVTWTQITGGLKIAAIGIDGVPTDVKIPYADGTNDGIVTAAQLAQLAAIPGLTSGLAAEVTRATGAEAALSNAIALKQDALTASELAVLTSGINAGKVTAYDNHIANMSNPHGTTAAQIGLGNVDNTSDANKPVSTLQQAAIDAKQDKNLGSAKADLIVTTDGAGNIGTDGSIQKGKLQLIKNLTSDAQTQLNGKVDKVTGYDLARITMNGAVYTNPSFYALTFAGSEDSYVFWDNTTKKLIYKKLPDFVTLKGNKTGDEINALTGMSVGEMYICTADSTTTPLKYANTAYYWSADSTWGVFCQTTVDLSEYQRSTVTGANSRILCTDSSGHITYATQQVSILNNLNGVTGNIQTQLDGKQATLTGSYLTAVQSGISSAKVGNYDAHIANANIHVTLADKTAWNAKQEALVSGTNIKTVNGNSLLGSGDITLAIAATFATISGDPRDCTQLATYLDAKQGTLTAAQLAAVNSGVTAAKVTTMETHVADSTIHVTTAEKNLWGGKQNALTAVQLNAVNSGITAAKVTSYDSHIGDTTVHITAAERTAWNNKQNALVSGTNIKTVGGLNIVGAGNADIIASDWTSTTLPQSASATLEKIKEYGATFRGTVPLVTDLPSITVKDINDWAIVTTDADHSNMTSRYCWTGSSWTWQYSINNMSFTVEQLAAINSGVTSTKVLTYDQHVANGDIHFSTAERTKLTGIEAGANKTIVDAGLSASSTNPVQNCIIKAALDNKADTSTAATKTELTNGAVTKLGTSSVGGGHTPIYWNAGQPNACTDDVGSATRPVYMNGGAITQIDYTLGNACTLGKIIGASTDTGSDSKVYTSLKVDNLLTPKQNKLLTGYAIASTSRAILATDNILTAIAILEKRIKTLEDANLVRYA